MVRAWGWIAIEAAIRSSTGGRALPVGSDSSAAANAASNLSARAPA